IKNLLQGIDLDQFKFKPNNNSKIIVSNRGFLPVYNNQLILEALKIDCDILESIKVHFLASGPLFEELETYAKSNIPTKLQSKIVFFNGVPHEKMPQYLSEARIFISCSKSDGTATSLLEAMACGVFPIVSNIPANTEWIVNEENGLVIDLNDPQALAIAIRRAIEDETLFDKTVKFNRKLVEEKASIDKNMKILIKTLKDKLCL
ncbi:MAG: glycosyltransferase family 4 protein, partial [Bdellovibrionales bacterium]|nr:glycosyltransferase family 4 protein [Bdellovibrionales bacterium]